MPCYNEEKRLGKMLDDVCAYLNNNKKMRYEIIIVDDGSTDSTVSVAERYAEKNGLMDSLKVLKKDFNRGKGSAVISVC